MLSFTNLKTSSTTLAEWSPADWPESLSEMRTIDNLLRCSICYEYFDVALIVPDCSHNYCSLCIRRSLSYETQCPTCMLKVNPPSLKSNRVLDELVKNFIKVRTKLLELVTKGDEATSETTDHKKGDQIKNKSSLTSNKRRKAHSRPENSSKSLSPDTKRPKLEEAGKEKIANPVDITEKIETEDSCSGSVPEVVVIETDDSEAQHVTSVHVLEPMVVEDGASESQAPQRPTDPDFAECPVCGDMISHRKINSHLDACLTRTEKKSSLRRKKSSEPKSICSTSIKRKYSPSVEAKDSDAVSSDDSLSCGTTQEPCSSNAARSLSTLTTKGSNSLIQTVQKRKPLPKLVYSVMADKELRQRLKEWNLSTKGDKSTLVRRHQDFVMLYNAQCDAVKPMTAAQVAREVEKAEKTRAKEASSLTETSTSGLHFDKNQSEEDMDKTCQKYLNEHQNEFDKLIADIQRRQRGKRKKTATKTSAVECLDTKMNEPGENILKPEDNDHSANTKSNDLEMKNSADNSNICLEIYPPFLKENDKDSSTVNESETSSIVPEPPSSPSLVSLPDEEEFTPSLGLDGDDDNDDDDNDDGNDDDDDNEECKDDEFGDTNVIPESPVIKVGKAADGTTDRETVTSESDEDLPQRQSSISNKRVKSNLF